MITTSNSSQGQATGVRRFERWRSNDVEIVIASVIPAEPYTHEMHCEKVDVSPLVCYLRFAAGKPDHSDQLPHLTARGEMLIADFDSEGRIIGIELVGPPGQKPCQEG